MIHIYLYDLYLKFKYGSLHFLLLSVHFIHIDFTTHYIICHYHCFSFANAIRIGIFFLFLIGKNVESYKTKHISLIKKHHPIWNPPHKFFSLFNHYLFQNSDTFISLIHKDVMRDFWQLLLPLYWAIIWPRTLITQSKKETRLVWHGLFLVNSCWLLAFSTFLRPHKPYA